MCFHDVIGHVCILGFAARRNRTLEERTLRGHVDSVYAVAWSRDGQRIASWGRDDTMMVWSASTFSPVDRYPMAGILSWSGLALYRLR